MKKELVALPGERISNRIFLIRGKKVMFDRDLAELYGVETKVLNQAVRRNRKRFPEDFMFQLSKQEKEIWKSQIIMTSVSGVSRSQVVTLNRKQNLRSQFVTSSSTYGGRRYTPYVFTEQGVAMLSSVLNSKRAIKVNIQIMRTFTKLREMLATHEDLRRKIESMEKKYDKTFKVVFDAIARLLKEEPMEVTEIGFKGKGK